MRGCLKKFKKIKKKLKKIYKLNIIWKLQILIKKYKNQKVIIENSRIIKIYKLNIFIEYNK